MLPSWATALADSQNDHTSVATTALDFIHGNFPLGDLNFLTIQMFNRFPEVTCSREWRKVGGSGCNEGNIWVQERLTEKFTERLGGLIEIKRLHNFFNHPRILVTSGTTVPFPPSLMSRPH